MEMEIGSEDVATVNAAELSQATGEGTAHDATVETRDEVGQLEDALAAARQRANERQPQNRIDAAERALAKAQESVANAEAALNQAYADNEAEVANREAAVKEKAERRAAAQAEVDAAAAAEQEGI